MSQSSADHDFTLTSQLPIGCKRCLEIDGQSGVSDLNRGWAMRAWYVAKSKPQKEDWLKASLNHLGVEVFFPRVTAKRRGKQILEPLFPTYLFCQFDSDDLNWPAIRWAPGLNYFLGVDGVASRVPDDLVDDIQRGVESWNDGGHRDQRLNLGDQVKVTRGAFVGLEGIFQRYIPSRERCRILLEIVGRLTVVELHEGDLAAAPYRSLAPEL